MKVDRVRRTLRRTKRAPRESARTTRTRAEAARRFLIRPARRV